MKFFTAVLLAIALSIDGFGVGLSYGIRKIKVSFVPIILIVFCSVLALTFHYLPKPISCRLYSGHLAGAPGDPF